MLSLLLVGSLLSAAIPPVIPPQSVIDGQNRLEGKIDAGIDRLEHKIDNNTKGIHENSEALIRVEAKLNGD